MKLYLDHNMRELMIMKDEFLKENNAKSREQIHKVLLVMGC